MMIVDHITEMAIVTAMNKTEVAEAVRAVGQLKMAKGWTEVEIGVEAVEAAATTTAGRTFTTTPVGKNPLAIETIAADGMAAIAKIAVGTIAEIAMTEGPLRPTIGPFRCRETRGLSKSC